MKNEKLYYKEFIPIFLFQTVMFAILFVMCWYGYNPEKCSQNIAYLNVFGWVICTVYILRQVKFKK